ncbi:hypothetical protein QUA30_16215 [Microcoleus sp. Pol14C2]
MLSSSQSYSIQASACFFLVCGNSGGEGKRDSIECQTNLRRVCDRLRLTFDLSHQHWHCSQTSCQIFNLKGNAIVTQRISGLYGTKAMY